MTRHAVRASLAVLLLLTAAIPLAPSARASTLLDYEPGQVVVKLAPLTDTADIHLTYGTTTLASLPGHPDILLLQAPPGVEAPVLVEAMAQDVRLLYAELNHVNDAPEGGSTDRMYGWSTDGEPGHTQDATKVLQLDSAHELSQGGGTLVAVLDTGVQLDHPALASQLDGLGYDFVDLDAEPAEEANGLDDDGDGQVDELYGHGTHVTGIVLLVAPEARILPLRVLNSDGRGNNFRTASAIAYATQRGVDAINLSLGTPHESLLLREVVAEAARVGVPVLAAAGNLNSDAPQYPAADACAIAVTAVDHKDQKAAFANYGNWIGVTAPGQDVYSTYPGGYAWWSGTSMATPFVAGQAALLRSLAPALTLDQLGQLIGGTADSIDEMNPHYRGLLGRGRIDVVASLDAATAEAWPDSQSNLLAGCNR